VLATEITQSRLQAEVMLTVEALRGGRMEAGEVVKEHIADYVLLEAKAQERANALRTLLIRWCDAMENQEEAAGSAED
tara:strand:+ start:1045 stop:1278 length:234 start_codon:yes stop_codon:yes gene_type:complete